VVVAGFLFCRTGNKIVSILFSLQNKNVAFLFCIENKKRTKFINTKSLLKKPHMKIFSSSEAKKIVSQGYNRVTDRYIELSDIARTKEREKYTNMILAKIPPGSSILELGCGIPTTKILAPQYYYIIGVDISIAQILRAKLNVPNGFFFGSMGASSDPAGYEEDWLGAPMYWSSFDIDTNKQMITESGLSIISEEIETL